MSHQHHTTAPIIPKSEQSTKTHQQSASSANKSFTVTTPPPQITYNDIAAKLLNDKLLLTALELHTELIEAGKELRQLKDFFSNPGNFELHTQEIPAASTHHISRSGSQVTLDSLDLTRFSEDGAAASDERVAVLEFELRKARETINALRNNLTRVTESETSTTPDKGSLRNIFVGAIKPHEQRALNFLINEYLLIHGYKLTSITFADENQSQDFDDWDDVGLNISKPPELLTLYREGLKQTGHINCQSTSTQTTTTTGTDFNSDNERTLLKTSLEQLQTQFKQLESDYSDLKAINSTLNQDRLLLLNKDDSNVVAATISKDDNSLGSESPERFEIIDKNNMSMVFNQNRKNYRRDSIVTIEDNLSNSSFNVSDWTNLSMGNIQDGSTVAVNEKNDTSTSTSSSKERCQRDFVSKDVNLKVLDINEVRKEPFKKEVFSLCYVNIPHKVDNEILDNILNHSVTTDTLVHTLSQSLLRIIPNIILNRREEALPLLISAVHLNPNSTERDKLLQQLFNLKKKPSETERIMILTGLVGVARFSRESLVENEILPQLWEQLTDKHVERRLLVAEACIALVPYVSSPIRNSLILSILQQMLDDREEIVRETVIRALSLVIALCDEESDKYSQCEELALNNLVNDSSPSVVSLSTQILFPVLGRWALNNGRLQSSLLKHLLHKLNDLLKDTSEVGSMTTKQQIVNQPPASDRIIRIVNVLENLLPFLVMSVASQDNILSNIEKDMAIELNSDFAKLCTNLTNPTKFHNRSDGVNVGMILYEFDKYVGEHPQKVWSELEWVLDMMIPDLLNNLNHIEITQHILLLQSFINLFSHICIVFGKNVTKQKIVPIFHTHIQNLEQILSTCSINQFFCPSLNIIPVYLVSVLSYCDDDDNELLNVLRRFLFVLPLCGAPLNCLELTVRGLCELNRAELIVRCLWDGVVHQRPLIRAASATLFSNIIGLCDGSGLVSAKITPALVTLASDNDLLVRTATIPALGSLITNCSLKEVHDKANLQIRSYITDSSVRDNHTLLRQLIVTLGNIVNSCTASFKHEVILPHLSALSSYMMQMSNQTRKIDMALALVEAFTNVVYSPLNNQSIHSVVMPGLRCLEVVVSENQSLSSHRDTVQSIIRECENRIDLLSSSSSGLTPLQTQSSPQSERGTSIELSNKISQNVNQGIEEVRQRVSKIFQKPATASSSLQNIFKK